MGGVVSLAPGGRRQRCVGAGAGLQCSRARTEAARCDSGLVLSEVRRHKYRPSAFRRGLTFFAPPEVDLRRYAVRIGDSSRLRGWGGVSRGAEDVLRTEESTLEKQVSCEAEDSYFPRCGAFGVWVIIGLHIFQVLSRVRACACLHRRPCCPPSVELLSLERLLAVILLASLCNAWVLSCQHQLQILACGAAHRSPETMTCASPRKIRCVRLRPGQVNRRVQVCVAVFSV